MKICSIKRIILTEPKQFYDVVEAKPFHNFLIATNSGRVISHNCAFEDEVNFGLVANPEKQKQKMLKLITQLDARMKSRFMRGTYLPTLNILASSKDTEQSFLDEYIKNKEENNSTTTLVVNEPQWVVDSRKDTEEKFWVAVGSKMLPNELPPLNITEEAVDELRKKGYDMWKVPIGYLETFQLNLDEAICSIIGIATASSLKYIAGDKITQTKTDIYKNPFVKDVIEVGDGKEDYLQYANFFDLNLVSEADKARPLFIHLDMSGGMSGKGGDKTGIAGVWITGKEVHTRLLTSGNEETNNTLDADILNDLHYKLAFSVSIKAPRGENISYAKNKIFIRWLREQGFAVKGVSMDTYQSTAVQQDLISDGFKVDTITVDRVQRDAVGRPVCLPYHFLKTALYGRQLTLYDKCDQLTDELINLERKGDGHVDHPRYGCFTGDTKVSLVDGRDLTMLELIDEYATGKVNFAYSFNETKKIIEPKPIINAFKTWNNAELLEVELDSGEIITCTPNHKFMLRDGSYLEAKNLTAGESLMPLYRKFPDETIAMKDYRMYYEPIEDRWCYEHRKFAVEVLDEKYLVHHKNCIKTDNNPTNLLWCSKEAHAKIHAELETGAQSPEANAKRKASLSAYYANEINKSNLEKRNNKIANTLHEKSLGSDWHKKQDERLERIFEIEKKFGINWDTLTKAEKYSYSTLYQRENNPETQIKISKALSEAHSNGKFEKANKALAKSNQESKLLKELIPIVNKEKFKEIFGFDFDTLPSAKKPPYTVKYRKIIGKTILNHKVKEVRCLTRQEAVYDLTIQDNHNFALSAGIFVHNSKDQADAVCGALWNASKYSEEYSYNYGDNLTATLDANNILDSNSDCSKQKMIADFEAELAKINIEISQAENAERQKQKEEWQYYQDISDGIFCL